MKDKIINEIASNMVNILNNDQLGKLKDALEYSLHNCDIVQSTNETEAMNNDKYLELFITSKKIEGCSTRTTSYYESKRKLWVKIIKKRYILVN